MRYRVVTTPAAEKAMRRLDPQLRPRIRGVIAMLAVEPHPPASRRLRGRDEFRVRVGDYRVLYSVHDDVLVVLVLTLGHRSQVYD